MARRNRKGVGGQSRGVDYRKLYLMAVVFLGGKIPARNATVAQLEEAVKNIRFMLTCAAGQLPDEVEIPNNWYELMAVYAAGTGVPPANLPAMVVGADALTRDNPAGVVDPGEAGEDESFMANVVETGSNLLNGNIMGAITNVGDTLSDWFSGAKRAIGL